jgi:hypothetical protein
MHHSKGINQLEAPSAFLSFNFPHECCRYCGRKRKKRNSCFSLFKMPALHIGKVLLGNVPSTYITNFLQMLYTSIE